MANRSLLIPALLLVLAPRVMHAQVPTVSPERQAAVLEAGRLANQPAEFVLKYRRELALSGEQVSALEKLAATLRDSSTARMMSRIRQMQPSASASGMMNIMAWDGPVDETAIRDAMREQSAAQAELMIASARDRRAVGALLTADQRRQLPQLQMAEMMKAARGSSN